MDYNHSQNRAIRHGQGPALITAGPGSGKTIVIINRLLYLILERKIDPEQILVATFTKAAAQEMAERFRSAYQETPRIPVFGTLHSIFFRILKSGSDPSLRIISQKQQLALIRKELQRLDLYADDPELYAGKILNEISRAKNADRLPEHCSNLVSPDLFRLIFRSYQDYLEQNQMMDYDDILIKTKQLLDSREDLLNKWQKRCCYILIDEFQDINLLQYQILRMLALPENNLFAVGDENQCIYGFRGSSPRFIKQFLIDYPGCIRIFLDVNYRCSEMIIRRSCALLEAGGIRFPSSVRAGTTREDSVYTLHQYHDQQEEAEDIVRQIRRYQSTFPNGIAVLLRSSREIPSLMRIFSESGISCRSPKLPDDFRDHFIVRDICSYFRTASRRGSRQDLLRIMNRPFRMVSRALLLNQSEGDPLKQLIRTVQDDPILLRSLRKLEGELSFLSQLTSYAGIEYLLHVVGYGFFLQQYAAEHGISSCLYAPVLSRLKETARTYPSPDMFLNYLSCSEPETRSDRLPREGLVLVDTMHASKGMEYDVVFLPRLNKGIIPAGSIQDTSIEEERRILYVAMTRARYMLHLSYTEYINQKKVLPSVFVTDLLRL
ncbi:MAG: ATP-dependent helicase [Parasporobacterium sp.]|nr:ATP-dependent helicase [Parasporobacterium sp.]